MAAIQSRPSGQASGTLFRRDPGRRAPNRRELVPSPL